MNNYNESLTQHLEKEDFLRTVEADKMKDRNKDVYIRLYNRVLKEWKTPQAWFQDETKRIRFDTRVSDVYWIVWSLLKEIPLPTDFIAEMHINDSQKILKNSLSDYEKLEQVYEKLQSQYSGKRLNRIFPTIIRLCTLAGVNNVERINHELVEKALKNNIFPCNTDGYAILNILYYMGYRDVPAMSDIHEGKMKSRTTLSNLWSEQMKQHIQSFLRDMKNCNGLDDKTRVSKVRNLNTFCVWFTEKLNSSTVQDLKNLTSKYWSEYVAYLVTMDDKVDKTKSAILSDFVQFYEWLQLKAPHIVPPDLTISRDSFGKLKSNGKYDSLAFDKREYGEKILDFLMYDFTPGNIREAFMKEAIIILANSGMRVSEERLIPYKSCFYSEDESMYKIVIDYSDKLNQIFRPIYITKIGYEAICRLEKIREESGILTPKYSKRTKSGFIHLFEHRGRCPINHTSLYKFLNSIKIKLGLVDKYGKPIKGEAHAFRHFFAMTLFRESGYNISVVRYLLGHRSYDMTFQYLEEEMYDLGLAIRNDLSKEKYSGKGLDTIVELLLSGQKEEFTAIRKALEYSKDLWDMISEETIKRVPLGYCLKPCDNANKCLRCNKFILSSRDEKFLIDYAKDLFAVICYKTSVLENKLEALNNISIQNDIANLTALLDEMRYLGTDIENIYRDFEIGDEAVDGEVS